MRKQKGDRWLELSPPYYLPAGPAGKLAKRSRCPTQRPKDFDVLFTREAPEAFLFQRCSSASFTFPIYDRVESKLFHAVFVLETSCSSSFEWARNEKTTRISFSAKASSLSL